MPDFPVFTCPECGATSHHPDDIKYGYCATCHAFTGGFTAAKAPKLWAGLTHIEVTSGTAQDGPIEAPTYRGFVTVRAIAENGSFMSGQLSPVEVRQMAFKFLAVAEAAEQDALVFRVMTTKVGAPSSAVAQLVREMREERDRG
jgi:hypothetical protein